MEKVMESHESLKAQKSTNPILVLSVLWLSVLWSRGDD